MASAVVRQRRGLVDPGTASAEAFRTLRLALQLGSESANGRAIVVTSPLPEDGKSTVAANYAMISAIGHGRVLLIDADLRRPSLHEFFGLPRSPGLVDVLAGGVDLADHVHPVSTLGTVDLLPAGRALSQSSDLAASGRMSELLREARERYTHIVIDAPPVLGAANAEALSSHEGVAIVMVVSRKGKRRPLLEALRRLDLVEANVAGLILNRTGRVPKYGY